ncbi:MAG TPA: LytR C-terminal domain-containing protein [Gaiellaceae bacterium]|nr:LytR C-terminal domain-containing protein [Gaiellaceae bacterium]
MLDVAHPLDAVPQHSPLAAARERRDLTVKQVAFRSGLGEQEIEWLEDGRLYRFPSQNAAILAAVVYATALGIDRFEARRLAGLPVTGAIRVNARARLVVVGALAALLSAVVVMVMSPGLQVTRTRTVQAIPNATLPPPWKLQISVENGNGDIDWTRQVASRIGAMGYTIVKVGRADRFTYPRTVVYYGAGGYDVALRLARQLGVGTAEAPGLTSRELLVVVGPRTVTGA